jgi:hypothetical protein
MSRRPPTPEEIMKRLLQPFDPEEEFFLELDRELERTRAMTPEEIRADLAEMGCDVAALERHASRFLGLDQKKRNPLGLVAFAAAPIAATVIELLSPSIPELLPMAAHAPTELPAPAAAAPPSQEELPDLTPNAANEDGGSDDARSR